jgi:hypothetical protein
VEIAATSQICTKILAIFGESQFSPEEVDFLRRPGIRAPTKSPWGSQLLLSLPSEEGKTYKDLENVALEMVQAKVRIWP